jgi:hypothetical protein
MGLSFAGRLCRQARLTTRRIMASICSDQKLGDNNHKDRGLWAWGALYTSYVDFGRLDS